jgi:hypothetical protein
MATPIESLGVWFIGGMYACFALIFLWVIGSFGLRWYKRAKRGSLFPKRESVNIRFEEKWTSGRSHRSFYTKVGGASMCLRVTVTDDELWIALHPPFNVLEKSDLEHRIKKEAITNVITKGNSTIVEFSRDDAEVGRIELYLRRPKEFLGALDLESLKKVAS